VDGFSFDAQPKPMTPNYCFGVVALDTGWLPGKGRERQPALQLDFCDGVQPPRRVETVERRRNTPTETRIGRNWS
jgi:hypothetical protein